MSKIQIGVTIALDSDCWDYGHCRYVATLKEGADIDTQMEREFIIQQLLSMIQFMDLVDQSSW